MFSINITTETIRTNNKQVNMFLQQKSATLSIRKNYTTIIENFLNEYKKLDKNSDFDVKLKSHFGNITIILYIESIEKNLLDKQEYASLIESITYRKNSIAWKYEKGKNIYTIKYHFQMPDFTGLKYVFSYLFRQKKIFVKASICRFINMIISSAEPLLAALVLNYVNKADYYKIIIIICITLAEALLSGGLTYLGSRLLRDSYSAMLLDMDTDITEKVLHIKTDCMDAKGSGLFTQRLTEEANQIAEGIDEILGVSTEVLRLICLIIAFVLVSKKMLIFEVVAFALYFLLQIWNTNSISKEDRSFREINERHTGFVNEMVRAHKDIKLLNCEDSFMVRMKKSIKENVNASTKIRQKSMWFILIRNNYVAIVNFLYLALLVVLMINNKIDSAEALVLYTYNNKAFLSSRSLSTFMSTLFSLALSSERIYQLLTGSDYEKELFGETHLDNCKGEIDMKNVVFSYNNGKTTNQVLNGVNVHINAGESVAFVGRSGCGKSTILNLIARLYDPDDGSVSLDGINIKDLDSDSLRSNISMVTQSPYIFNMSIRENLTTINNNLTEEEMRKMCKIACIDDDIMNLPDGYDTIVGEGGISLSGGQRQRLAVARSIIKNSPILILDETTSALDNITQTKLQKAIENMRGNRTIIMVAHRLSTVINCEKLFFVSDGKIIAEGTHNELMQNCKEYYELYSEESNEE